MRITLRIDPPDDLDRFRAMARRLLAAGLAPENVGWTDDDAPALFSEELPNGQAAINVPREFPTLARAVACHRDPRRWSLLYQAVWRFAQGERALLQNAADPLVHALHRMEKSVRHDSHRMTAFVRFRSVTDETGERFIAWHEPRHRVLRMTADFFIDRFAAMRFSILTPDLTLCWDGEIACFTPGLTRADALSGDCVEAWWQRYYAAIFNPARLNPKLMQSHMPAHFWRNLPEARLIASLVNEAGARTERMIQSGEV
jgi:probable DNA metabolism protein